MRHTLDAYGFGLGILFCLYLASCGFVENVLTRKGEPDTRVVVYPGQWLRVPYKELDNYRCSDGGPIVAEPYGAEQLGEWEITCWRSAR